jgi:hypothetical protein
MITKIRRLQHALRMGDGELLRLAREIAHDGALIQLRNLTSAQRFELESFLLALLASEVESEHVAA